MRSAENVVDEIAELKEKYGIKAFIFEDDNPFCQKQRTKEMLRLLKMRKLDLKWKAAGVAVFMMDEEIFKLMAETGCEVIGIAIESGTDRVLKQIVKKPVNLESFISRIINPYNISVKIDTVCIKRFKKD